MGFKCINCGYYSHAEIKAGSKCPHCGLVDSLRLCGTRKSRKSYKPWEKRVWKNKWGYVIIRDPCILNCPYLWEDGRIYEHHLVIWLAGIPFDPATQDVHHIDCNPSNNRLDNLEVLTKQQHVNISPALSNLKRYRGIAVI